MTVATDTRTRLTPRLRAEDIAWRLVGPFLEIRIDVTNPSSESTEEAQLVIETAEFGAFVPFKPGARVTVPELGPEERHHVIARIPLAQIATPVEATKEPSVGKSWLAQYRSLMTVSQWAGNLNIYFDTTPEQAIELHRALGLKVRAGRKAQFMLIVDSCEEYSIETRSSDPQWKTECRPSIGFGALYVVPPAQPGARATVEVLVTRVADGKTVPVVFDLETVDGEGQTLGCIQA
jgi:hypothetical protein